MFSLRTHTPWMVSNLSCRTQTNLSHGQQASHQMAQWSPVRVLPRCPHPTLLLLAHSWLCPHTDFLSMHKLGCWTSEPLVDLPFCRRLISAQPPEVIWNATFCRIWGDPSFSWVYIKPCFMAGLKSFWLTKSSIAYGLYCSLYLHHGHHSNNNELILSEQSISGSLVNPEISDVNMSILSGTMQCILDTAW